MKKKTPSRGGKREGAGPDEGKEKFTVSLNSENVAKAKKREKNFSGLIDRLLIGWLSDDARLTK